jgi:3'5'-cyclic nucleotide phosphodiesterase/Adenylate and Guanylate cyclase catalytic domain
MNTCSRIESTGERNKIHMSRETAEILMARGKAHWCRKREESVSAKGKGILSTFWLEVKGDYTQSTDSSSQGTDPLAADHEERRFIEDVDRSTVNTQDAKIVKHLPDHVVRLAKWNADLLGRKLCTIVSQRAARKKTATLRAVMARLEREIMEHVKTPLEEVQDAIKLNKSGTGVSFEETDASPPVDLAPAVVEQLHSYLVTVALLYRDNPFHCFEHATHVTMSVVKLLSRVEETGLRRGTGDNLLLEATKKSVDTPGCGTLSDPLTQFAVVFSALIHDVDHKGVPNVQLAKEGDPVAAVYSNQSPAEQNSVDVAWSLLMGDEYQDLRAAIYSSPEELLRFRQLVVNAVMATDIMDGDLNLARKERWSKAFSEWHPGGGGGSSDDEETSANRKATIVIEHLIQASDVAHTMQHWNIYRKWNTRFFEESYQAFVEGRAEANPADNWYEGEIGFFDHYIIPLAMKLKDCGAFGVSSDEYLTYAQQNRREWENQGRELVEDMVKGAAAKRATLLSKQNSNQRTSI